MYVQIYMFTFTQVRPTCNQKTAHAVEAVFDFDGSDGQLTYAGDVIGTRRRVRGSGGKITNGITGWFPSAFCSAPLDGGLEESAAGERQRYRRGASHRVVRIRVTRRMSYPSRLATSPSSTAGPELVEWQCTYAGVALATS